jgi:hypothetical protein
MAKPAPEGVPIDEWCASAASNLWDDYVAAQAATRGFDGLRRYMPSALRDDEWHLIRMRIEARAALVTWLADSSGRGEIELWARPGSRIEDSRLIPPSAVRALQFNYEGRTAVGSGLPNLYDVRVRLPPAVPVKRWRKPPPAVDIKAAALAVAKTFQPNDPPIFPKWWEALNTQVGKPVTRKVALDALADWAPHLKRRPGQTK